MSTARFLVLLASLSCLPQVALADDLAFAIKGEDDWRGAFSGQLTIEDAGEGRVAVSRAVVFEEDASFEELRGVGSLRGNRVHAQLRAHLGAVGKIQLEADAPPVDLVFEVNGAKTRCRAYCKVGGQTVSRSQGRATESGGSGSSVPLDEGSSAKGYAPFPGVAFIEGEGDGRKVHPNDVTQGQLADCYLMAALIAVAKSDPAVIEKAVSEKGDGSFTVQLIDVGTFYGDETVTLDSEFPYMGEDEKKYPAFARFGDQETVDGVLRYELWPALIEKAYAKYKGGYGEIEYGHCSSVFSFLTGETVRKLRLSWLSDTAITKIMGNALKKGWPVAISTLDDVGDAGAAVRLHGDHCYAVWEQEADGFRLNNPWGFDHPSAAVTPAQLRKLGEYLYVGQF